MDEEDGVVSGGGMWEVPVGEMCRRRLVEGEGGDGAEGECGEQFEMGEAEMLVPV